MRVSFPERDDLPEAHPCWFKPHYWGMYAAAIKEQLVAAGVEVVRPAQPEPGLIARYRDGARETVAVFDYADQVHVDGLVDYARERTHVDLIFKHKTCLRYAQEYGRFDVPVVPAGYFTAPSDTGTLEEPIEQRAWFERELPRLREQRDQLTLATMTTRLNTRGAFHALDACPERLRMYHPVLRGGEKGSLRWREHMADVARSRWLLNACGPDNTIDRKVVEAARIGTPILSNDGLADLVLPFGERFVHGENIWYGDQADAMALMQGTVRGQEIDAHADAIRLAARALRSFDPAALGHWIVATMLARHSGQRIGGAPWLD